MSSGAGLRAFLADHAWACAGLVLLVLVLYRPAFGYGFVNWDDGWYVTGNPLIKGWSPANLYGIATETVARNYAPLTIFTFLLEHTFFGLDPAAYHATNIVLHAINTVLVFALVRRFVGSNGAAWAVAALFAVHPVQVESVAWISSRKTLLSATFMLMAGLQCLKPGRTPRDDAWGLFWLVLALAGKASAVTVPAIVICYDVLLGGSGLLAAARRQLLALNLCAIHTLFTMTSQVTIVGGVRTHLGLSHLQLLGVDATILTRYLRMLAWPSHLAVLYDPATSGIALEVAVSGTAWAGASLYLFLRRHRYPQLAFAMATWLLLLFPMLNFFPLTTLMNDRYLYLPCVVPFALVVEGARRAGRAAIASARVAAASGMATTGVAVACYLVASMRLLPVWTDPIRLWSYTLRQTPTLAVVHIQWACALHDAGDDAAALVALQGALDQTKPDEPDLERIREMQAEWTAALKK